MRSAITGLVPFELFSCIELVKETLDEKSMFPCLPCNVEAVLRNEEVYKADLRDEKSAGDIERLELLCITPAMERCITVADCLSYFNHR